MKIDKNLLPMKLHYFLFNGGTAPTLPYLPTLAKDLGFSSTIVGTVYTFLPILGMIAKPTMGAISDRFQVQKIIFTTFIILFGSFYFVIPFIPAIPYASEGEIHCDAESIVKFCSDKLKDKCFSDQIAKQGLNINCKMTCEANSSFIESVCDTWKQPQYCSQLPREPLNVLLTMAKQKTGHQDKEVKKKKILVTSNTSQTIVFNADLLTKNIEQIDNCVFLPMGQVEFLNHPKIYPYCNSLKEAKCETSCNSTLLEEVFRNPKVPNSQAPYLYQFWLLVIFLALGWMSNAIVVSIGDTICFELLGDFPSKYGYQRLWGSVGWGVFSLLSGLLIDYSSSGPSKNYLPAFIMMVVLLFFNVIVKQSRRSTNMLEDIGKLLGDVKIVIFLIWCVAIGMGTAIIWNYLLWHLEDLAAAQGCDSKNWIKTLEGLVMGIQCFGGELPFFFLSGRILKKLGHINVMTLVLFAFGIRFLLYSLLTNPWWCLPIELLNGLTFSLFYATMTSYASLVAPPGTETTIQGIVGAVFEGVGVSLGSFIGGLILDNFKGVQTFRIFGISAIILSGVHYLVQYKIKSINSINERDFKNTRYAAPNDAINMLEDNNMHDIAIPSS